jgi:hypothetical protein
LIWKTINVRELSQWIEDQQAGPPPEAYELLAPPSLKEMAEKVPLSASDLESITYSHGYTAGYIFAKSLFSQYCFLGERYKWQIARSPCF